MLTTAAEPTIQPRKLGTREAITIAVKGTKIPIATTAAENRRDLERLPRLLRTRAFQGGIAKPKTITKAIEIAPSAAGNSSCGQITALRTTALRSAIVVVNGAPSSGTIGRE